MSKETTKFVYVTYIVSTPEKVFEAITKPEIAERYWAHENVSDWQPGSKWEHVRSDAARDVKVVGKVVECSPPTRLVITWASPSDYADLGKHSRVTFDLTPFDNMVRLSVTHDELEVGSAMATGISNGWPRVLSSLKSFLETGRPIDVFGQPTAQTVTAARSAS
ncbi:SRPBCC family protein [Rhizobium sp. Root1220]|uniref:SRPBCC family protein n=1 Tax=Rhizobium sp. Root1220 TaxID=1736432 RepID=UPI0006FF1C00|nr:SRPBCC family protein [Rhizobium sp. Root1220]KQV68117.1 polyketide cyclase [Rhizobium sp. Root1220]